MDVADPKGEKTCGWLLSEVCHKYLLHLELLQKDDDNEKKKALNGKGGQIIVINQQKRVRRFIVALKTRDFREGIDSWITQYER